MSHRTSDARCIGCVVNGEPLEGYHVSVCPMAPDYRLCERCNLAIEDPLGLYFCSEHGTSPKAHRRESALVDVAPELYEVVAAAVALRESEHRSAREKHGAHIRLYNALDALPAALATRCAGLGQEGGDDEGSR
jgi:hypothetical protein